MKNRFINNISISGASLLLLAGLLTSCEEPIKLDLRQTEPKIVIEAQVTNHPGYQYVKVSRSTDFYSSGETPRITDAVVTITDDLNNHYTFVHNPGGDPDSTGYYLPDEPFTGTIGRTYTLTVVADGQTFGAQDYLASVTKMDSLSFGENKVEKKDPKVKGRIYDILMFTHEPQDEVNYYYFKFYRNDSLTYNNDTDVYYSDDQFLAGNIDGVESPVFYSKGDNGRVEMYSISRAGYVYFNDLSTILNNDGGGMFGPIPAAPRTNLSNGALGFFQVSALDISTIKIE